MVIELSELKHIITQSAQLGAAAFQKLLEPTSDYVSQRDVRNFSYQYSRKTHKK